MNLISQKAKELVEEAIKNGYIDYYDEYGFDDDISLFYGDYEIWLNHPDIVKIYNDRLDTQKAFYSEELFNQLKRMFDSWEAI